MIIIFLLLPIVTLRAAESNFDIVHNGATWGVAVNSICSLRTCILMFLKYISAFEIHFSMTTGFATRQVKLLLLVVCGTT